MQVENNAVLIALGQAFSKALAQTLCDACSSSWTTALLEDRPAARLEGDATHFRFTFSGSLEGASFLAIRNADVAALGLKGVAEGGFQEGHAARLGVALEGSLEDLCGLLAEHGAVSLEVERASDVALPEHGLELRAKSGAASVALALFADERLMRSLEASAARGPAQRGDAKANLDLVLDVELSVTLRFGQRQLSLREVLDLTSGSVVELDRQVDEPVELVLDGRVVARGEAVIIDGNYGMRITQVLQPIMG
jgi:flagellar motor switch protein FliN/FliY